MVWFEIIHEFKNENLDRNRIANPSELMEKYRLRNWSICMKYTSKTWVLLVCDSSQLFLFTCEVTGKTREVKRTRARHEPHTACKDDRD